MRVNNWLSGFACVLLLGVVGCKKDKIREGIPVVVEKVGVDDVEIFGDYVGRIRARQFVEVHARVEGYLEKMLFEEGKRVERNQPLFIINPDFELFADENVRRALTLLIDRDMIYEQSNGTLFPAYNLVSDFAIGYSEEFTNWFQENYTSMNGREEAIALLAEAGWTDTDGDGLLDKDGQVFEFTLSEFNHDSMFLNLLQIQLMDVGILMNIDPLTNSTEFRRLLGKEGWEVGLASNSFAEISSILVGHLEQVKMAGLFSDEEYAKLDELFVKAQSCLDNGKAEGYYNEVLREIVGTGCYIPISTPAVIIVYDKDVYDGVYYRRDATKIWLNDCE